MFPLYSMDAIQHFTTPAAPEERRLPDVVSSYSFIDRSDVAYAKVTPCFENGKGLVGTELDGPSFATTEITVLRPNRRIDQRFLAYLVRTTEFREAAIASMTGAGGLKRVSELTMRNYVVSLPPLAEQRRIADYLDRETAEIDAFVEDLHKMTASAEERLFASLSEVFPYPTRFTSGSLRVPRFTRLKVAGDITLGKMLDTKPLGTDRVLRPYLRAANVQPLGVLWLDDLKQMPFDRREASRLDLRHGDVVVVEGGAVGRPAYLEQDLDGVGFQNSIIRVRPRRGWSGKYLTYALLLLRHIGYVEMVSSVASIPHFTAEKVAVTPIPVMPLEQQRRIVARLDQEWHHALELAEETAQAITLAKERRAALISAAVTGKLDVSAEVAS